MNQNQQQQMGKYLNGELSYTVGVSVFLQLSTNPNLNRYFLLPHSPEREDKLKYELQKITKQYEEQESIQGNTSNDEHTSAEICAFPPEQTVQIFKNTDRYTIDDSSNTDSSVRSGLISQLEQEQKNCYRKRGHLHGQLHAAKTDQERYELALDIINLQKRIDKLNQDRNSVNNGSIPGEYMRKDRTASEFQRIRNLKHYISRIQKQLSECSSINQKNKLEAKLSAYQKELNSFL
jgi:hypothetical protein